MEVNWLSWNSNVGLGSPEKPLGSQAYPSTTFLLVCVELAVKLSCQEQVSIKLFCTHTTPSVAERWLRSIPKPSPNLKCSTVISTKKTKGKKKTRVVLSGRQVTFVQASSVLPQRLLACSPGLWASRGKPMIHLAPLTKQLQGRWWVGGAGKCTPGVQL